MMDKRAFTLVMILFIAILVGSQSMFTVYATHRAVVLQLGEPVGGILEPGLHFKLPFIQNVLYFDVRLLNYDTRQSEALTKDNKVIVLDNYARWRIVDPIVFYQRLRTVPAAQARLQDIIYSELRRVVAQYDLTAVVSGKRADIMREVLKLVNERLAGSGVKVVDVRIKRTDLPAENQRAIFGRMEAERKRQATQYRSEGDEVALVIRSTAERERARILADARQKSEELRGEGDATAIRIFADAFSRSPEFFEFSRSLDAYKKGLRDKTRIILDANTGFLRYTDGDAAR